MGNILLKNPGNISAVLDIIVFDDVILIDKQNILLKGDDIEIPNHIDTIKFRKVSTENLSKYITSSYSKFTSNIPSNVKKIICESIHYSNPITEKISCNNFPSHIEYLELDIYANKKEIFPNLNNLPVSLKYLKINSLTYVSDKINDSSYNFVFDENNILNTNDILLKINIKIPFECKITLPNGKTYDDVNKIFFKLKYIFSNMNFYNHISNNINNTIIINNDEYSNAIYNIDNLMNNKIIDRT